MSFLIDTNIVSEFSKRPPHPAVVEWFKTVPLSRAFLSVAVIAEVRSGIENQRVNRFGVDLEAWLAQDLLPLFKGRILGVDEQVADLWGRHRHRLAATGAREPIMDALIAATAQVYGLTVVTRNVRHFAPLGVAVFDPCSVRRAD